MFDAPISKSGFPIDIAGLPYFYQGKSIFAYTTNRHLILDIDDISIGRAKKIAQMVQKEFRSGDCLIVRTSRKTIDKIGFWKGLWIAFKMFHKRVIFGGECYTKVQAIYRLMMLDGLREIGSFHLVFNNVMDWEQIKLAIRIIADKGFVEYRFWRIRQTKMDITIRFSPKYYRKDGTVGYKPKPTIATYLNHPSDRRDECIDDYVLAAGLEHEFITKVMHLPTLRIMDDGCLKLAVPKGAKVVKVGVPVLTTTEIFMNRENLRAFLKSKGFNFTGVSFDGKGNQNNLSE